MKQQKNIPALRFPGFTGEWEKKKLGEVFKISAGGDIEIKNVSEIKTDEFQYPIYANAEKNKGLYGYSDIYKVEENVITVAGRGVNIGIAHARDHKFYPIVRLLVLKPLNNENIYFFENEINRLDLFKESTGVPQLTAPQVSGYEVAFPNLPEQQKIAAFLTAVDEKLQSLKKKKALLEQYKKGVMQQLFTGQLRFKDAKGKDFPDWEEKKLGEIAEINPSNKTLPEEFIYIDLESVARGVLLKETKISKSEAPSRAQRVLKESDILFQMVRPYQMNNLFFTKKGNYVASTGYAQIRTTQNSMYIFQYLHFQEFVDKVIERCTGTSYPAINSTDLANIKISIPPLPEQTAIAQFLSALDNKIAHTQQQIAQTEQWKKGLLQQLFV